MPNNWKLYFENVKDTYHASILHLFLTTFRINRLSQHGGISSTTAGAITSAIRSWITRGGRRLQRGGVARRQRFQLEDRSVVESVDEYGDGISVQILTSSRAWCCSRSAIRSRFAVIRPRGVEKTELEWIHMGFETDDEAMTERRLRQGNLIGAAGYISMEDGCIGGLVQRGIRYNDDGGGVVMMGGYDAEPQHFRASEAAIRGFWKNIAR